MKKLTFFEKRCTLAPFAYQLGSRGLPSFLNAAHAAKRRRLEIQVSLAFCPDRWRKGKVAMTLLDQRQSPDDCLAQQMPRGLGETSGPEGALIADEADGCNRLAVVYEHGDTPPEITITQPNGHVQMVCADGVAVAIIGCASGPQVSVSDIMLVERFEGLRRQ